MKKIQEIMLCTKEILVNSINPNELLNLYAFKKYLTDNINKCNISIFVMINEQGRS